MLQAKPVSHQKPLQTHRPPVVIGATGGTGTRALQAILAEAGVAMGQRLNYAGDAEDFIAVYDRWINPILGQVGLPDYRLADLDAATIVGVLDDLRHAIAAHTAPLDTTKRWGWKNPRSMYLLPVIAALYPDLHFIHVLRDGRDMALSENQNQRDKHYAAAFRTANPGTAAASARLWAEANIAVADWGERCLGPRYIRLRIEDLCTAPRPECARLLTALDLDRPGLLDRVVVVPQPQASFGRWRSLAQPEILYADTGHGDKGALARGLARFGYA